MSYMAIEKLVMRFRTYFDGEDLGFEIIEGKKTSFK